ncbi:Imm21 family immunity protein [Xanthomonas fragariae]|uniref:Imm21 family immunity protein n=1 Tax=Xanthomonas fragariae TaxID=48664 RepID=UPI0022AA1433|nr:Imm21 family immunity protein [Xanthomonas fragariae]WAT15826.1 Imm21 family immunity protein [Xanthomonas fragariae]
MKNLNWIESTGGPLILLHRELLPHWSGIKKSLFDADTTDYSRACDVHDELGVVAVGPKQALVLGDEPDATAIIQNENSIFIVRWRWAPSENELLSTLHDALNSLEFCDSGSFSTTLGTHLLFDSSIAGTEVDESLIVELGAARFSLANAYFQPKKDICALIHRLEGPTTSIG